MLMSVPTRAMLLRSATAYCAALLTITVLDGLWLGFIATDIYQREMGGLINASPHWIPAAIFYFGYPVGIVLLSNATHARHITSVLWRGALVGLMAYGAYDLTNLAVLRGWPVGLSALDMAWGTALSACGSAAAYGAVAKWAGR